VKYQPPYGITDPNAGYVNGDPSQGLAGSIPPAQSIEYPQREITNLITFGGYIPSDADLAQMTRGVRRAAFAFATDTGSVNSLSIALFPPIAAYEQGTELRVLVGNDNTGQATIRVDGLNTQQIIRKDGTPLLAGDLRRGGVAVLVYDGTNFQLVSGTTGSVNVSGTGWFNGADWIVDIGTVNHLVGTPPVAPTAYSAGQGFSVYIKNANTGPIDLNVNNLGAKPVKLPNGVDLQAQDIIPNMVIHVWYDGTNFIMLTPIHLERIETALTKIVGPNAGADFADLIVAMEWLGRRRIGMKGLLTLSLQGSTSAPALAHPTYTQNVIISHPDGDRLNIVGPAPVSVPTSHGSFTYHNPPNATNINADTATNVATMRSLFRTELKFAAGFTLFLLGRVGLIRNFMVSGPGLTATPMSHGIMIRGGRTTVDTVASCNFNGACFYIDENASLDGRNVYGFGTSVFAFGLAHASVLLVSDIGGLLDVAPGTPGYFFAGNSYVDGIQAAHGAIMQISCVGTAGVPQWNGGGTRIAQCGQRGIDHWGASSLHLTGNALINVIGWIGVQTVSAFSWLSQGTLNVSTANQGVLVSTGGGMDASTVLTSACAAGDYFSLHGSYMYAAAFQNGSAQFSPARNVVGNGNSYIEG